MTALYSHFLYMILDGKKTTRSQFSVPGLHIHMNLKQEKNFNSREGMKFEKKIWPKVFF